MKRLLAIVALVGAAIAAPVYYVQQSTWADGSPRTPLVLTRLDTSFRATVHDATIVGTDTAGRIIASPILSGNANLGSVVGVRGTNIATGQDAVALGAINQAVGYQSFALGTACYASGTNANAFGNYSTTTGNYSFSLGDHDTAQSYSSFARGAFNKAAGQYSDVSGFNNIGHYGQTIVGRSAKNDSISDAAPTVNQKVFKVGWNGDVFSVSDSGRTVGRNLDTRKSMFKISLNSSYPTTETLIPLTFDSAQDLGIVIPPGYFKANSSKQITVKFRIGIQPKFPGSALRMFVRTNSSSNGAGVDGTILGQCAFDLSAFNGSGIANLGLDVDAELWVGVRAGSAPDSAIPVRSHMNWKSNNLSLNTTSGTFNYLPFGGEGYETATNTIDSRVTNTLYFSILWIAGIPYRSIASFPTDGNEWAFGRIGAIDIPGKPGVSGVSYLTPVRVSLPSGESVYALGARATTAIAGGSNGVIRKSVGNRQSWTPRRAPQNANAWRGCFFASWLGISGRWILVGDNGAIATSDDDGDTWTNRTSGGVDQLSSISGSSTAGLQVGTGTTGKRYYSTDGITWNNVTDRSAIGPPKFVKVVGPNILYAGSTGRASYSTDNGSTWTDKTTGLGSSTFVGVDYDSTLNAWSLIHGAGGYSEVGLTFGGTWNAVTGLSTAVVNAFGCNNLGTCLAADNNGIIWQTTNGTSYSDMTSIAGAGTFWGDFGYSWE